MSTRPEELLAEDARARLAAQTEFGRPVILEAGAGTGKTTTLVSRILSWCLGDGWSEAATEESDADRTAARVLEGVVAITFTEAAAAEMSTRFAEALSQAAAPGELDITGFDAALLPTDLDTGGRAERATALLGALDHLTVRTIHSFCRGLLATHPIEAGVHPDLRVDADARLLEEVVREVVETAVKAAYSAPGVELLASLGERGVGPQAVAEAVRELCWRGFPAAGLAQPPFSEDAVAERLSELRGRLDAFFEAGGRRLGETPRTPKARDVVDALEATLEALDALVGEPLVLAAALCDFLRARWGDDLMSRLKRWARGDYGKSEERTIGDAAEDVARATAELRPLLYHLLQIHPVALDEARRALEPLVAEVQERLRSQGIATFDALLLDARNLLQSNRPVRARESARIRQLLVDEFQDTDRSQCDIVRALALSGPPEGRPGLFVVGDPKQSIYGWRNADLGAYSEFLADARAAGGERYALTRNFRSSPPILAEVERVVAPVMTEEAGVQPSFQGLVASSPTAPEEGYAEGRWAPVEYWVFGTERGASQDEAALEEAESVADDLHALHHEQGIPWKDCGVLLRSTSRLDVFLTAMRAAGVPFVVTRDKHYYRRREIIEAAALVRAIVNPVDHLALLTTLRSASVGVPDAALIPLWGRGFPRLLTELEGAGDESLAEVRDVIAEAAAATPSDVPGLEAIEGWEDSLLAAVENIGRMRESLDADPPDVFIEKLRRLFLTEVTEGARYLGPFRVANLERFYRGLGAALEERGGDIHSILRALGRAVRRAEEAEEALPKDVLDDAVQVLTIHTAKGLEFKHVYLVQIHAKTGGPEPPFVDVDERWTPDGPFDYSLFRMRTPGFDRVEEQRARVEAAERVRTLYVAMTRARERLVLSGAWTGPEEPKPVFEAATYLDLLHHRDALPSDLAALEGRARRRGWVDAHGARWRFPAEPVEARLPFQAAARTPLRETPEVEREATMLVEWRAGAAERMARPFSGAASAESDSRLVELFAGEDAHGPGSRPAALAVGTEVHRVFELWDFDAPPEEELERRRTAALEGLATRLSGDQLAGGRRRLEDLLERLAHGSLLGRFHGLGPRVLGREVPVAVAADEDGSGPVGLVAGVVDMVYAAGDGSPVIVDFKTDQVESEDEIAARAEAYSAQEGVYRHALQQALDLPGPPAFELWFLWPDRVWPAP